MENKEETIQIELSDELIEKEVEIDDYEEKQKEKEK